MKGGRGRAGGRALTLMFSLSCGMLVAPMMVDVTNQRLLHHASASSEGVSPCFSATCGVARPRPVDQWPFHAARTHSLRLHTRIPLERTD